MTDATESDDAQSVIDANREAAIADETFVASEAHCNPGDRRDLYAAHAKRCQCAVCSGSPPGSS